MLNHLCVQLQKRTFPGKSAGKEVTGITARSLLNSEAALKLEALRISVAHKLNASLAEYVERFERLNKEFAARTAELGRQFGQSYEGIAGEYARKVKAGDSKW